ncbi:hypothetical protein EZS27_008258 [termite gut metagenome]|uniref:Uncharacterized protein n=1 Tax=termite gut metagenome TaxID=433724 RepID=A0A5J4SFQ4_9ZZZZ
MELVIQILILFIVVNGIIKLSFWKLWQATVFGLICGIFIIVACRYAILQSKTQLADYLRNIKVMQDIAVLVTVDSAVCFAFCFTALKKLFGEQVKRWVLLLCWWYPGLLLFPVLFYILTQMIFAFSGADFKVISYILASTFFVVLLGLSRFIRYLYPEKELQLEVHFLVSFFVCVIGLITTVNGNVTYKTISEPLHTGALLLFLVLFVILFLTGFFWNKVKWRIHKKSRT